MWAIEKVAVIFGSWIVGPVELATHDFLTFDTTAGLVSTPREDEEEKEEDEEDGGLGGDALFF